jgi:hypothetical protein
MNWEQIEAKMEPTDKLRQGYLQQAYGDLHHISGKRERLTIKNPRDMRTHGARSRQAGLGLGKTVDRVQKKIA